MNNSNCDTGGGGNDRNKGWSSYGMMGATANARDTLTSEESNPVVTMDSMLVGGGTEGSDVIGELAAGHVTECAAAALSVNRMDPDDSSCDNEHIGDLGDDDFNSPSDNGGSNNNIDDDGRAMPSRNFPSEELIGNDNYGVPPMTPGAAAAMGMSGAVGLGGAALIMGGGSGGEPHPYGTIGGMGMGGAGGVALGGIGERQDSGAATQTSESMGMTATQTHEIRMPMMLPTFKPATGCTDASDFIVRCFVARLRAGITVVKHGRSRWCKSRLRILHVHADGRSLSWKPALGEPSSGKRPPKLDLSSCREVRHAWSPDPENPMFTGTPILRQKCEAANAHKSFALVFPKRTVDITAVTADQCKVLMEGFSALCFRLQVSNMANRQQEETGMPGDGDKKQAEEDEDRAATVSLTNTSEGPTPSKR